MGMRIQAFVNINVVIAVKCYVQSRFRFGCLDCEGVLTQYLAVHSVVLEMCSSTPELSVPDYILGHDLTEPVCLHVRRSAWWF